MTVAPVIPSPVAPSDDELASLAELLAREGAATERQCNCYRQSEQCERRAEFVVVVWCDACGVRPAYICNGECIDWVMNAFDFGPDEVPIHCTRDSAWLTVISFPERIVRS